MRNLKLSTCFFLSILSIVSCKTNDVEPIISVSISANTTSITENEGSVEIIATLSEMSSQAISVSITTSGTATNGLDYSIENSQINIPANSLTGSILITALQDTLEEGNEVIEISINTVDGASFEAEQTVSVFIADDDVPFIAQIIINEVLFDPSNSGLDGDANGDGAYSQAEDEFIEFINLSLEPVDISGYRIYDTEALDSGTPRHIVPDGTIIPVGGAFVVFGGGIPTGAFGGAIVQTSTTGDMNLSNAGDIITLTDATGVEVITFDIEPLSNNPNESYTRNPDITGDFEQHSNSTPLLFSPGTKIDETAF